jgi:hypothetical protein
MFKKHKIIKIISLGAVILLVSVGLFAAFSIGSPTEEQIRHELEHDKKFQYRFFESLSYKKRHCGKPTNFFGEVKDNVIGCEGVWEYYRREYNKRTGKFHAGEKVSVSITLYWEKDANGEWQYIGDDLDGDKHFKPRR